jgi:hypothetical protein
MRKRLFSSAVLGFIATIASAHAAAFDVYRAACLDTNVDLAAIRVAATTQKWSALTEDERDTLAPGNGARVEGWAIAKDGGRYLVSVASSTASGGAGDRSGSAVASCSVLTPKADEAAAAKAYSAYLKRQPGSTEKVDGISTYTWSTQDAASLTLHYLVAGGTLPGLSLSVSSIRK